MTRGLVALMLVLLPSLALAKAVGLRSGEHEGYTRLVFDFDTRVTWSVEKTAFGAEVSFSGGPFQFDDSAVFDRISRGRLRSLTAAPDGNNVILEFACDCEVEGFWHSSSMLVLDISGPENSVSEATTDSPDPGKEKSLPASPPLPLIANTSTAAATLNILDVGEPQAVQLAPATKPNVAVADVALDDVRDELVKQFSRAASQGLLTPNTSLSDLSPDDGSVPDVTIDASIATEPPAADIAEQAPIRQLRARSSMDSAFLDALTEQTAATSQALACLDPALTDVGSWARDAAFWQQVSERRAALTGEFDRIRDEAVVALARLYIHFGFGLEARQVLDMAPGDSLQYRTLTALAEIMDRNEAGFPSPLHRQLDCDGRTAMWSALAHETLPTDQPLETDEMIAAFSSLPRHLRSHLGPTLAKRFLTAGLVDASDKLLRILDRTPNTMTARSELINAESERAAGQDEKADLRLEKLAKTNSESAVPALLEMIESLVRRGQPVSYDTAQLAGVYAFEHRDGVEAKALQRAHILALMASGAFDEAYAILDTVDTDHATTLRPILADILARDAPEMMFLKHVLAGRVGSLGALDHSVSSLIASRLFKAGFVDEAARIVDTSRPDAESREDPLLRAEIALAQGLPRKAEVELLGLDGKDVNALRARARSLAGEHEQARELYLSAGLSEDAEREAWLAASPESGSLGPDRQAFRSTLARNRELLEDANSVRSELSDLLSDNPVPELKN